MGRSHSYAAAGFGEMDRRPGESADGARDGEPHLAKSLRNRHCCNGQRFRTDGRAAESSRTARLAGETNIRGPLPPEDAAPAHSMAQPTTARVTMRITGAGEGKRTYGQRALVIHRA